MSYAFDVMASVWASDVRPRLDDERLAMHFEMLIEAMHSANHRVPSANGVFKGDGVNKDPEVTAAARELDEYVKSKRDRR